MINYQRSFLSSIPEEDIHTIIEQFEAGIETLFPVSADSKSHEPQAVMAAPSFSLRVFLNDLFKSKTYECQWDPEEQVLRQKILKAWNEVKKLSSQKTESAIIHILSIDTYIKDWILYVQKIEQRLLCNGYDICEVSPEQLGHALVPNMMQIHFTAEHIAYALLNDGDKHVEVGYILLSDFAEWYDEESNTSSTTLLYRCMVLMAAKTMNGAARDYSPEYIKEWFKRLELLLVLSMMQHIIKTHLLLNMPQEKLQEGVVLLDTIKPALAQVQALLDVYQKTQVFRLTPKRKDLFWREQWADNFEKEALLLHNGDVEKARDALQYWSFETEKQENVVLTDAPFCLNVYKGKTVRYRYRDTDKDIFLFPNDEPFFVMKKVADMLFDPSLKHMVESYRYMRLYDILLRLNQAGIPLDQHLVWLNELTLAEKYSLCCQAVHSKDSGFLMQVFNHIFQDKDCNDYRIQTILYRTLLSQRTYHIHHMLAYIMQNPQQVDSWLVMDKETLNWLANWRHPVSGNHVLQALLLACYGLSNQSEIDTQVAIWIHDFGKYDYFDNYLLMKNEQNKDLEDMAHQLDFPLTARAIRAIFEESLKHAIYAHDETYIKNYLSSKKDANVAFQDQQVICDHLLKALFTTENYALCLRIWHMFLEHGLERRILLQAIRARLDQRSFFSVVPKDAVRPHYTDALKLLLSYEHAPVYKKGHDYIRLIDNETFKYSRYGLALIMMVFLGSIQKQNMVMDISPLMMCVLSLMLVASLAVYEDCHANDTSLNVNSL